MCAVLELNSKVLRPGKLVGVWRGGKPVALPWAGFARHESLHWWKRNGAELVDVPASRFAERSDRDRRLIWEAIPSGNVVRGIVEGSLLKIVTRASSLEELGRYEHDRMPLIETPIFSADPTGIESDQGQAELW